LVTPELHKLTPDSPLWEWALEAVSQRLEGVFTHTERVRLGADIEAVHDMRVGSRRLVAAMKVFALAFPGPDFADLSREARGITRRLGAVRDLDVLIDHYQRLLPQVGEDEALGIGYLTAILKADWKRARRPMLAALRQVERTDLAGRLRRFLREESEAYRVGILPIPTRVRALFSPTDAFRAAAPPALEERYRELYDYERYVEHPEEPEHLHEMRIKAKWLRYTMELFAPAYRDELKKPLGVVKRFQELLGDLHDSDVRLWLLEGTLGAPLQARGLEALELLTPDPVKAGLRRLLARETRGRRKCYEAFRREWRRQARAGFAEDCLARIRNADA
jgi:CHAD domain-containing protein